jgi:hypothetical protein
MEQRLRLYIASANMLKPDDCSGVVEQHQLFASALTGKIPSGRQERHGFTTKPSAES